MNEPKKENKIRRVPLSGPIPVRFSEETVARMDIVAPRIGGNRNTVIRLAVLRLLPELEAGRLTLS